MAYSKQIAWDDGSNDKIYFSAPASAGNQTVEVSSDANAGNERTKTVNFNASGVPPKALTIVQLGSGREFDDWLQDGDTHLWINILQDDQLEQTIRIRMIGTIDWGDGSAKTSANVSARTNFTHTYTQKGRYRIDLHPTSGTFLLGGNSASYSIMGGVANSSFYRRAALYQAEIGSDIITEISNYSFYYCAGLRRIYIPKNIVTLGSYNFHANYSLSQVIFEDASKINTATLTNIFNTCNSLQDINDFGLSAGDTLNGIIRYAYCLREFTIPSAVATITSNAFQNVYSLKYLHCLPTTAPTVANSNAFTGFPTTCIIEVPFGSLSSYQSAGTWSTYASQMVEAGKITYSLTNVISSSHVRMVSKNGSFVTNLEAAQGYTIGTVTVKMGGVDITNSVYSNGVINIPDVTGNIEITASASN